MCRLHRVLSSCFLRCERPRKRGITYSTHDATRPECGLRWWAKVAHIYDLHTAEVLLLVWGDRSRCHMHRHRAAAAVRAVRSVSSLYQCYWLAHNTHAHQSLGELTFNFSFCLSELPPKRAPTVPVAKGQIKRHYSYYCNCEGNSTPGANERMPRIDRADRTQLRHGYPTLVYIPYCCAKGNQTPPLLLIQQCAAQQPNVIPSVSLLPAAEYMYIQGIFPPK